MGFSWPAVTQVTRICGPTRRPKVVRAQISSKKPMGLKYNESETIMMCLLGRKTIFLKRVDIGYCRARGEQLGCL